MIILILVIMVTVGSLLSGFLISPADGWSHATAFGVIVLSFLIPARFKVARRRSVSKMGTDWLSQALRQMIWRMALTLGLAAVCFRLAYPAWGLVFWLSVAGYYQVGLLLHLRELRSKPLTAIEEA